MNQNNFYGGPRFCACGCGEKFRPTEDIRQKYVNKGHYRRVQRRNRNSRDRTRRLVSLWRITMTDLETDGILPTAYPFHNQHYHFTKVIGGAVEMRELMLVNTPLQPEWTVTKVDQFERSNDGRN